MTRPKNIESGKPEYKRRPWWVWVIYAVLFLLLIAFMVAYWIWSNRMGLLEQLAIDTLAEDGVEAELTLDELTKTHLTLKNVTLRYEGEPFFSSESIRAEYQWRDLLEGRLERLEFARTSATITIDESFNIIDGWVPPGFGETGQSGGSFPPRGVLIQDASIKVDTPYGTANLVGAADIKDFDNLTADISMSPTTFSRETIMAEASGQAAIEIKNGQIKTQGQITLPVLSHPSVDSEDLTLRFDGTPILEEGNRQFAGDLSVSFTSLDFAQAELGDGNLSWSGQLEQAPVGIDADGKWGANVKSFSLPDPARTRDLARTLSLSPALSATPVAQHFVPQLEQQLFNLFSQSMISGAGTAKRDITGLTLSLDAPITAKGQSTALTLTPSPDHPVYRFDRAAQKVDAYFDVALTRPAALKAKQAQLTAKSINGWRLDGIETFKAQVSTGNTWQSQNAGAALRPFQFSTRYDGRHQNHRRIYMAGAIDYDGPLPGGIVDGLQTAGDMDVHLRPNRLTVDFTPKTGQLVTSKVETTTGWTVTDISGLIGPAKPLFDRIGDDAKIDAVLSDLSLTAVRDMDGAKLDVVARTLDLNGTLSSKTIGTLQNWNGDFTNAVVNSDDIPGPDTHIDLGGGAFTAALTPMQPLQFSLDAPAADIKSPLIQAKKIGLDVSGTPDTYTLNHTGGLVKLTANDLPPMPLEGAVTFANGQFIGKTVAYLPQANNTPINIAYQIKDSAGSATVDIDQLRFSPGGLQPQSLIPALKGKVAQVDGTASAKINLAFAADQPMRSFGTATLNNINFGTAPGPLTGVSTQVELESVLPLKTRGRQTLTVDMFDPGIPLVNGVIEYELVPEGVKVFSARWPLGDGFFSLDPFTWKYLADANRMTLRLERVGLGEFINNLGNGALQATGELEGAFPIVISGINVRVENGYIRVPDGGRIQYAAVESEALTEEVSQIAGAAMEALRDFRYQELSAKINGPLDGAITVGMIFEGKNDKVLGGQPFAFDVTIEGELFNILRSFNSNEHIKSSVAQKTADPLTE